MNTLTLIENKSKKGEKFTKDDLVFLYEINEKIQGFGLTNDPRIKELREKRNIEEDMPIVFECSLAQIARSPSEVTEDTKAYVGELFSGVFQKNIEYIYTSFPEGKLAKYEAELGKTKKQYEKELDDPKYSFSFDAQYIFNKAEWSLSKNSGKEKFVRLTVKDMGFSDTVTTEQIYKKAEEFGLELCPPRTGSRTCRSRPCKGFRATRGVGF